MFEISILSIHFIWLDFTPQVNALDGLGQTALHRVAQQGNMQACRLLMSYGVDSSIVSLQGYTAAQLATENIQKMLKGNIQSSLEMYKTYKWVKKYIKVNWNTLEADLLG